MDGTYHVGWHLLGGGLKTKGLVARETPCAKIDIPVLLRAFCKGSSVKKKSVRGRVPLLHPLCFHHHVNSVQEGVPPPRAPMLNSQTPYVGNWPTWLPLSIVLSAPPCGKCLNYGFLLTCAASTLISAFVLKVLDDPMEDTFAEIAREK